MAGQYLLARVAGRRSFYANGSEFGYLEKFLGPGSLAIALSQSGETIDVIDSVRGAKERGAKLAAIVNVQGSTLYRLSDDAIFLGAGPERCVLATKSFTAASSGLPVGKTVWLGSFHADRLAYRTLK